MIFENPHSCLITPESSKTLLSSWKSFYLPPLSILEAGVAVSPWSFFRKKKDAILVFCMENKCNLHFVFTLYKVSKDILYVVSCYHLCFWSGKSQLGKWVKKCFLILQQTEHLFIQIVRRVFEDSGNPELW